MQIAYTGDEALLTIGTGPDHGMIDISINGRYWRRFNTYTAQPGERVLHIPAVPTPPGETFGKLSIKVRSDNHFRSTGHVFRFKQLAVIDTTYNERTIDYTYDGLSRLLTANYDGGADEYTYGYDLAGNLTNNNGTGQPPVVRTFNAANQLTNDGTHTLTYDANGNLTNDGTNTYTWDHASRMLTAPNNTSYTYDGLGNRVSQTVGTTATNYLLDLQPGLTKVLAATTGANTDHYIHASRGIHAMESHAGDWSYTAQDGLGSVRSLIDATLGVDTTHTYDPYGNYIGTAPTDSYFGFTGEQTDANGQLYLRARYYNPALAIFPSLDPFEGTMARPMSLNGYAYVEGNPILHTDPAGQQVNCSYVLPEDDGDNCAACRQLICRHNQVNVGANPNFPPESYRFQEYLDCLSRCKSTPYTFQGGNKGSLIARIVDQILSGASEPIPDNPCAKPYKGGLYVEGIVVSAGLVFAPTGGWERVWDFANMQVSNFGYGGFAGGAIAGASLGMYAGVGGGFERNGETGIDEQYAGRFEGREGGVGLALASGLAIGGFNSPAGSDPWIYATYAAATIGLSIEDLIAGASVNKTEYKAQGNVESFVKGKYVVPDEVAISVQNGWITGQILGPIRAEVVLPQLFTLLAVMRNRMSLTARKWAEIYNTRTDCEKGGRPPYPDPRVTRHMDC